MVKNHRLKAVIRMLSPGIRHYRRIIGLRWNWASLIQNVTLVLFFRGDVPHARRPKLQFPFLISLGATMKKLIFISGLMLVFVCSSAQAITFNDTFAPPSALWSNSIGNWTGGGGQYFAQSPSNSPETYSGLPFDFTNQNFQLTVSVNHLSDGGIWLNTDGSRNNGVLLVLGGNGYGFGHPGAGRGPIGQFFKMVLSEIAALT